jgi:hypothetical protein
MPEEPENCFSSTFRKFNIFLFIIHDPEGHPKFHNYLAENFDRLDYLTGENLVFFSLVDPPEEWRRVARRRDYYQEGKDWLLNEIENPSKQLLSPDKSITATALQIPLNRLPCIIITDNLRSPRFLCVEASQKHLDIVMMRAGYIAARTLTNERTRNNYQQLTTELFQRIERELSTFELAILEIYLKESFAKTVADMLSFVALQNSPHPDLYAEREAKNRAKNKVEEITLGIQEIKTQISQLYGKTSSSTNKSTLALERPKPGLRKVSSEGTVPELLDTLNELTVQLSFAISNFSRIDSSDLHLVPILKEKEQLEHESIQFLKTGYRVIDSLQENRINFLIDESEYDFSPGLICFAKVFENEINLSIVHWIRQQLGIMLPDYFCKYQPYKDATKAPSFRGARLIDFNKQTRGDWQAPGIGESRLVARDMAGQNLPPNFNREQWKNLDQEWVMIHKKRNASAHSKVMTLDDTLVVKQAIEILFERGIFARLNQLKQQYRGDNGEH